MYSYRSYNQHKIKANFPNDDIVFNKTNFKTLNGMDYVCFGKKEKNKFSAHTILPLYHMRFTVKKIINNYNNNYYYILANVIEYQHGQEMPHVQKVVIEGYFYNVYPDAEFECLGYWKKVSKHCEVFVLTEYNELITSSTVSTFNYLKHVLKGNNLTKKTLEKLFDLFGTDVIDCLKNADPRIENIIKSHKKILKFQKILLDNIEKEKAFKFMLEYEIPSNIIVRVLEKLEVATISKIRTNPYLLMYFEDISLKTLDLMAQNANIEYNNKYRIQACILYYMKLQRDLNGDIYVELSDMVNVDEKFKNKSSPINKAILKLGIFKERLTNQEVYENIKLLESNNKLVIVKDVATGTKDLIYKKNYFKMENFIVNKIFEIKNASATQFVPTKIIEDYLESLSTINLDQLQKDAVVMALQNKLSILTGGPGTGKTQTIKMIVQSLRTLNPKIRIELCAPTGKASKRMTEMIGIKAETIHKKLNFKPFEINDEDDESLNSEELNEIGCDFLIIDETSMIDIELFYQILSNIADNTSILLVGDDNQIPSVGPGLILRDMIESRNVPCVQLTKIFRQSEGSEIIEKSKMILMNEVTGILDSKSKKQFRFEITASEEETYQRILQLAYKCNFNTPNAINALQVLTPMNDGYLGTLGLNKGLQEIFNPLDASAEEVYVSPTKIFREGDKLIQTRNNYELKVFNGSIGTLMAIKTKEKEAVVEFDEEEITYSFSELNELKQAYAITVHKSQGSEFDYVIMPVSSNHYVVNNRNLLYTALTRAKKGFVFVGDEQAFKDAIEKIETSKRKSQIKDKLKNK